MTMGDCHGILRDVAGFLCPASLLVHIVPGLASNTERQTFLHESFHYQQVMSSPFGYHLVLLEQRRAMLMPNAVHQLVNACGGTLNIPIIA